MKSQDIFVLLKIVSLNQAQVMSGRSEFESQKDKSARSLAALTGIGKTEVNNSINRSINVGLAKLDRVDSELSVNEKSLYEFIVYGLKYVFPVKPAELTRGIPTAFAAPIFNNKLMSAGETIFVWPDANSKQMGQAISPLYKTVTKAIVNDENLYGYLALVDAIRIGNARESNFAKKELAKRMQINL